MALSKLSDYSLCFWFPESNGSLLFYCTKIRVSAERLCYDNIIRTSIVSLEYTNSFPFYDRQRD